MNLTNTIYMLIGAGALAAIQTLIKDSKGVELFDWWKITDKHVEHSDSQQSNDGRNNRAA